MTSRKKVPAATEIQTNDFLFVSQVLCHLNTVCCGFQKNVAQVFCTSSRSTYFAEGMEAGMNSR